MNYIIVTAIVVVLIALICTTVVTVSVFKYIDKVGDAEELKKITTSRALFNFYAIVMLTFIIFARALNLIDAQLFIALFVADIGGLGLKISSEILQKQK